MSLTNNMHQGTSPSIDRVISSRTFAKRKGLRAKPCKRSIVMGKSSISPPHVRTFVYTSRYISGTILMYFLRMPFLVIAHQITSLGTLSYDFSKSIKTMCKPLFLALVFHHLSRKMNCFRCRSPYYKSKLVL